MNQVKIFEVVFDFASGLPSIELDTLRTRLSELFPGVGIDITERSHPCQLFFTSDGTKALLIEKDGTVVHEYVFNDYGIPVLLPK